MGPQQEPARRGRVSAADRRNPLFEQIATKIQKRHVVVGGGTPVTTLAVSGDFPHNAVGQTIDLNGRVGEVVEVIQGGAKFRFRDFSTGEVRTFLTAAVLDGIRSAT